MDTFYLQITKKILISSFIYFAIASIEVDYKYFVPIDECKRVNNYLDISFKFIPDSVKIGDSLRINVLFRNKTDTLLQFYPRALLFLIRPVVGFEYQSFPINDTVDMKIIAEIKPRSTYLYIFNIKVNEGFFKVGIDSLSIGYICPELKGRFKIYNKLCGSLESLEEKLYIGNENWRYPR